MSDASPATAKCPMCEQPVIVPANFCGTCGFALTSAPPRAGAVRLRWYHNIWFILFLMLFVLGPFALPLVWKHPKLSRGMKLGLNLIGLIYTGLMVVVIGQMFTAVKGSLDAFNSSLQQY